MQAFALEVLGLALLMFTVGAVAAFSQNAARELPESAVREGIQELVSMRHPADGERDRRAWLGLGTSAPHVIVSLLATEERVYSRVRMIEGLQYFEGPEANDAREAVRRLLGSTAEPILKQASLGTLGRWGQAQDLELISKYLSDPAPSTRQAAREALRLLADRSGDARVQQKFQESMRDQPARMAVRGPIAVSSSDQAPHPYFAGEWRGLWIDPLAGANRSVHEAAGLVGRAASLVFSMPTPARALVSPSAEGKILNQRWVLERIKTMPGQAQRLTGMVRIGSKTEPFEAELIHQSEAGAASGGLLIRVPAWSATFVARKP